MMNSGATVITVFHPSADRQAFDAWLETYIESARAAEGFAGSRVSVHEGQLDWGVEVTFENLRQLDDWLDGSARQTALREGEALGHWRRITDLVMSENAPPPPGVSVFLHDVTSGREPEFVAAQADLATRTVRFPGCEGTLVFPPDSSGEWRSVLRFRTAHQLTAWLGSRERREALPQLRANLARDFAELPRSAPFGATVRTEDGETKITPGWKTAMLVLLCLYPTVMVLSRFFGPTLDHLGAEPWLTLFVSNCVSVALLQWVLVPRASRPFRRWLDPIDGSGIRISLIGVAILLACYAGTLAVFATVKWLQYWDYGS